MSLIHELENTNVYYDNLWDKEVKDRFCGKLGSLDKKDEKYFTQHWQGFAWASIIGFINDKRIVLDSRKLTSFKFSTISRQSPTIGDSLILMAIAKSTKGEKILESPSEILEIISEYAKGGAKIIKEIRETPGNENKFNIPDDYLAEIEDRK